MFKDKRLKGNIWFINLFEAFSAWISYDVEGLKKNDKLWVGFLCSLMKQFKLRPNQPRGRRRESLPHHTFRLYKLTKYFTMECLHRHSFATLQLTPLLPTFPSIDTTDIPVLAQMRCMLPTQRYFLYRVLLILLKETYFLYDWSPVTASAPLIG